MATKKKQKKKTRRRRRLRLLPITVTMLSLLFIIKVNELYIGSQHLRDLYGVRDATAEEKKEEAAKEAEAKPDEAKKEDAGHGEEKTAEAAKEGEKPKEEVAAKEGEAKKEEAAHGDAKAEDAKKEEEHAADAKKEEGGNDEAKKEEGHGAKKPEVEPRTFGTGKSTVKEIEAMKARDAQPKFTQTELDLLQNLSKRREELDARERDLELKSKVLDATDKRINDKITEMKALEVELTKVLAQYNEKQDVQIKSLVKIYESMKPDEAAAIFNELEMPILLEVISKMSERKVAPVLANMNPKRARDVTQELAEKRKKNAARTASAAPAKPAN